MNIDTVIWLLPAVFMVHDFEEIIFMKAWLNRNASRLRTRFPRIASRIIPHLESLSTEAFALCVAEEFILLCLAVLLMAENGWYSAFAGLVLAYGAHLIVHLVQALAFRSYIPAVLMSLLTAPYCFWALFSCRHLIVWTEAIGWAGIFLTIIVPNLLLMHLLAGKFDAKIRKKTDPSD